MDAIRVTRRFLWIPVIICVGCEWSVPQPDARKEQTKPVEPKDPPLVVSTWSLVGLGLETLRQQVQHRWSVARLRTCLPRLPRFLCRRPRRREHQETAVRAWLAGRNPAWEILEDNAA